MDAIVWSSMSQHHENAYGATQFEVRVREDPLRTWVTPSGELDLAASDTFDRCLWGAQTTSRRVVLDLRALEFIDSVGLRSLVGARLRAVAWRRHLEIINGPGQVQRMMSLCGHDQLLGALKPPPGRTLGHIRAAA